MVLDSFNERDPLKRIICQVTVINTKLEHGVKICHVIIYGDSRSPGLSNNIITFGDLVSSK